jgi:hypothetical protein
MGAGRNAVVFHTALQEELANKEQARHQVPELNSSILAQRFEGCDKVMWCWH